MRRSPLRESASSLPVKYERELRLHREEDAAALLAIGLELGVGEQVSAPAHGTEHPRAVHVARNS